MDLTTGTENLDQCPQCKQDLVPFRAAMEEPSALRLCPSCQFPVVLVAGKYRMAQLLGEGAFGKVYLARHIHLQRDAERAIKIIKSDFFDKPGFAERFIREVQVTSSISQRNEHIVRVYDDFGNIPGVGHFYVMEFLEGGSLLDLLEHPSGRLPTLPKVLQVFGQLCKGMAAAHEGDIVHRDLKPENVVLIERAGNPHFVKIVDFGIARPLDTEAEELKLTQGALGTPLYMAPEQCAHKEIDARTDIYSMGIILFEMLVGYPPFAPPGASLTPFDLLTSHLMQTPPSPRKLRPDRNIPPALEAAVLKALEKKRTDRFQSVEEFWRSVRSAMPSLSKTSDYGSAPLIDAPLEAQLKPPIKGGQDTAYSGASLAAVAMVDDEVPSLAPTYEEDGPTSHPNSSVGTPLPSSAATILPDDLPEFDAALANEFQPNRKPLFLLLLLLLLLGTGGGIWFGMSKRQTPPNERKQPTRVTTKRLLPTPPRTPRPRPEPPRPEPAKADVGAKAPVVAPRPPKVRKRRRRRRLRRRRRSRRRAKARKPPKRRPAPALRPTAPPLPAGCPAGTGLRWTKISIRPGGLRYKLRILSGSGQIRSAGNASCVGFSSNGSLKLQVTSLNYRPCTLRIQPGKLYQTLKLQLNSGIETGGDDYCK